MSFLMLSTRCLLLLMQDLQILLYYILNTSLTIAEECIIKSHRLHYEHLNNYYKLITKYYKIIIMYLFTFNHYK